MKKTGFTLIEIMIVVGIIGLLAGLGAVVVTGSVRDARIEQAQTELEMISAAVLQMAWDTGRYPNRALRNNPGSTEIWNLTPDTSGLLEEHTDYPHWNGPYYEDALIDPWGKPYFFDPDYRVDGGVMRPVVGSFGPNKKGPNQYDDDDIYVRLDD